MRLILLLSVALSLTSCREETSLAQVAGQQNYFSDNNSTLTAVGDGEAYTGSWEYVGAYSTVVVGMKTDQPGTLQMQFSPDGTNADGDISYDIAAGIREVHCLQVTSKYYRVVYTDDSDSAAPSYLRLQSQYNNQPCRLVAPYSLNLGADADAIASRSIPGELDIARGKMAGFEVVNKFGRNSDVDSGSVPEDVWSSGSTYTGFPASDVEAVEVLSSSTEDDSGGTGALTVVIEGLDANYERQSETITLDGQTPVDSANTYTRVNRAYIATSASSNTAFNVGTITVRHTTTTANVFLTIPAGEGQSQLGCYTVPAGYKGYMENFEVMVSKGVSANVSGAIYVKDSGAAPKLVQGFTADDADEHDPGYYGGLEFAAQADMCVRITSASTTNVDVRTQFTMVLVEQ